MTVKTTHRSTAFVANTALSSSHPIGYTDDHTFTVNHICLAIGADKFFELLLCKAVCMSDFHCLDASSKQRVWQWYLEACCRR